MDNSKDLFTVALLVCGVFSLAYGLQCHCSGCDTAPCHVTSGACFLSAGETPNQTVTGCLPDHLISIMCVQSDDSFQCCYDNLCNKPVDSGRFSRSARNKNDSNGNSVQGALIIVVSLVVMTTIASLLATTVCCVAYSKSHRKADPRVSVEAPPLPAVQFQSHNPSYSGSNSCIAIPHQSETISCLINSPRYKHPLSQMIQRSIAQQTILEKSILKSSWCHKYQGRWRQDRISVKVFNSRQVKYWYNENQILQLPIMHHENILCFVAADIVQKHSQNFHYLISEHHPRGTLREHLAKATIEVPDMASLVTSLVGGVEYLHSDMFGGVVKTSIAHRNITSASIQVKNSGCCCLGDFELAIKSDTGVVNHTLTTPRDPRYLPPEILSEGNCLDFDGLLKADVYSLGLMLWEIAQCTSVGGKEGDYSLPFSNFLSCDKTTPTIAEMQQLVCVDGKRPQLPEQCHQEQITRALLNAIEACWTRLPKERPITSQLKQKLQISLQPKPMGFDKNNQPVYK